MIPRREMIKVSKLTQNLNKKQKDLLLRVIAAAVMLIILFILPLEGYPVLRFALFMIPYLTVGHDILRKSWKGIRNGQVFDECFLMAVATIGAMILGEYPEGVAVMLFYQIGELFQSIAVGRSRRSISELMDIRPDYANLEQDGEVEKVDPDDVEVGSIIVIRPGEKVPIDGVVVEGTSSLNTSALTGESLPRDVGPGDDIISGSVNMSGLLRVETTKEFDESTASKILELVHEICQSIYTCGLHRRIGAGGVGTGGQYFGIWEGVGLGALEGLDLQSADLPRYQLSLRDRRERAALVLWRDRRRQQPGHPDQGFQFHGDAGQRQICRGRQDRDHYEGQFRSHCCPRRER